MNDIGMNKKPIEYEWNIGGEFLFGYMHNIISIYILASMILFYLKIS